MKKLLFYTISSLLISFAGTYVVLKAQELKPLLHFVQISDIHLQKSTAKDYERLLGSSEKLLTSAVQEINKINKIKNLDFVLGTGDLVDMPEEALVDKFIEITMSLKQPFYVLFGNHDVGVNGSLGKNGFIKKFTDAGNPSFTDNMTYYSFSPNEKFTIICLDGTTEKVITAHGQIEEEDQFKWLHKELEKNKNKFVIIALHFPLIEPYKSQTHFFVEPDRTKLLDLINSYKNVIGVFTGHYHAAKLFKINNKIHNSCPAAVQWPNAFREIIITQDSPKYLNVEFKWHEINGLELREKSKNASKSWAVTQGAQEDREQTVKVKLY